MAPRKKSSHVEEAGVRVRVFRRGTRYWLDVRMGGAERKRVSAETSDKRVAEENASALAKSIAAQLLLGVQSDTVTLGQLFTAYSEHKGRTLEGQWKRGAETRQRTFLRVWGDSMPVASISQSSVDGYSAARRAAFVAKQAEAALDTPPRPLRDGALDCDFRWLSSVFNWGLKHKLSTGKRLLTFNPLHDCKWPREKNIRRPIASHDRYLRTVEQAPTVDPAGRLRAILALARYTGRRESAILQLRASDILLSRDRLGLALAAAGMDERLAEYMPHGAIRWTAETDKQGVMHVTPIAKDVRDELEAYLLANPRVGDVPLFPSVESPDIALSRSTATKWLLRAETLAKLPKLSGGIFHPYRRLWATERKHLPDVDVAQAGGWTGTKAMKISYQGATPDGLLAAVVNMPASRSAGV